MRFKRMYTLPVLQSGFVTTSKAPGILLLSKNLRMHSTECWRYIADERLYEVVQI